MSSRQPVISSDVSEMTFRGQRNTGTFDGANNGGGNTGTNDGANNGGEIGNTGTNGVNNGGGNTGTNCADSENTV